MLYLLSVEKKRATCHPEKKYWAKGFCRGCYTKDWNARHPDRIKAQKQRYGRRRAAFIAARNKLFYEANKDRILQEKKEQYIRTRERRIAYAKAKYHADKDAAKNARLLRYYGITLEQFNNILVKQSNICAMCIDPNRSKKTLHVDHDHTTGKVRGLLCSQCNTAFGLFNENIELLEKAITYANEHKTKEESL